MPVIAFTVPATALSPLASIWRVNRCLSWVSTQSSHHRIQVGGFGTGHQHLPPFNLTPLYLLAAAGTLNVAFLGLFRL